MKNFQFICDRIREEAAKFLSMNFEQQVKLEIDDPVFVGALPFLALCREHEECRKLGKKFTSLHCEPSRAVVREYVANPQRRNAHSEEVIEFSFRHVAMCGNAECSQTQEWLNALRASADPMLKDMIRRWDHVPLPAFRLNGIEEHKPNPN